MDPLALYVKAHNITKKHIADNKGEICGIRTQTPIFCELTLPLGHKTVRAPIPIIFWLYCN